VGDNGQERCKARRSGNRVGKWEMIMSKSGVYQGREYNGIKSITGVSCGPVKGIEEYITSGDWSEKVINFSAKYSSEGRHIGDWAYIRVASRAWG